MARRVRVEEIGFYHIINRGVERRDIFLGAEDRDQFIKIIDESAILYKFMMHSFCLMDNHLGRTCFKTKVEKVLNCQVG